MKKTPGDIYDAYIPHYSSGIEGGRKQHSLRGFIVSKIQKVLVLGGNEIDYYCLPIVPEESYTENLPIGSEGYTNPLQLSHVGHHHFRHYHTNIVHGELRDIQEYVQSLYTLLINKGCTRVRWAHVPMQEFIQERFAFKTRPCVIMPHGLTLPMTTNNGKYTQDGPVVSVRGEPGKVINVPLFLPENFIYPGRGFLISSREKSEVQNHLIKGLPNIFKCLH